MPLAAPRLVVQIVSGWPAVAGTYAPLRRRATRLQIRGGMCERIPFEIPAARPGERAMSPFLVRAVLVLLRVVQVAVDAAGPSPRRIKLHRMRIELMRDIGAFEK